MNLPNSMTVTRIFLVPLLVTFVAALAIMMRIVIRSPTMRHGRCSGQNGERDR